MKKHPSKIGKVMKEYKEGTLHSGKNPKGPKKAPIVKNRKQAIAIALSEAGMSKKEDKTAKAMKLGIERGMKNFRR